MLKATCKFKFLIIGLSAILGVKRLSAQSRINCCKVNQNISFEASDWSFLNNQFAVKANIVPPINSVTAEFEIRIYSYCTLGMNALDVIRSSADSLVAVRYAWTDLTHYDGYAHNKPFNYHLILNGQPLKFPINLSCKEFITALIDNHLFFLPSGNELNIEAVRNNPATQIMGQGDGCSMVIEMKVGNGFRVLEVPNGYYPTPTGLMDFKYLGNLLLLLNSFRLDHSKSNINIYKN